MPNISLYFVRHGQRIDQVDSSWATTSPCPQDPPLTHLGKQQARQTGKMIRDFAHESSSSSLSPPSFSAREVDLLNVSASRIQAQGATAAAAAVVGKANFFIKDGDVPQQQGEGEGRSTSNESLSTFQRMTPPESPDFSRATSGAILQAQQQQQQDDNTSQGAQAGVTKVVQQDDKTARRISGPSTMNPSLSSLPLSSHGRTKKRPHHFAIVTSPFLRCSQTAIEMAIGMRSLPEVASTGKTSSPLTIVGADANPQQQKQQHQDDSGDAVTIAVETGLSEWLSMDYVSGQPPESIIVQRIQEFAMSRRDHEQFYTIDWKYQAKDRTLPSWPESREDMQERLERALAHVLLTYTGGNTGSNTKYKDHDLSIIFVTHASPVNALLEACLETPILVPVPNCSISRCRWTPSGLSSEEHSYSANNNNADEVASELSSVLVQSTRTYTIAGEDGRWLLDYQTHTSHLDRDRR